MLGCKKSQQIPSETKIRAEQIDVESLTKDDAKQLAIVFAESQAALDSIDSADDHYVISVNKTNDGGWRIFFDKKNSLIEGDHFTIRIEPERGMLFFGGY